MIEVFGAFLVRQGHMLMRLRAAQARSSRDLWDVLGGQLEAPMPADQLRIGTDAGRDGSLKGRTSETAMTDWKLPWRGGCRCGQVRVAVSAPPLLASACHCTGCQTMSASAFSLSLAIPTEGFAVTAGEPVLGGLHGPARHYFCPRCMSWMFTQPPGLDQFVNLRPSMLDDHAWVSPFVEFWACEKLAWAFTPAPRSFATEPGPEAFPELIQAFAQQGARPG